MKSKPTTLKRRVERLDKQFRGSLGLGTAEELTRRGKAITKRRQRLKVLSSEL